MSTSEDNQVLTSWIYRLNKDLLSSELLKRGLQAHGSVDEMRKRLSSHLKDRKTASMDNLVKALKEEQGHVSGTGDGNVENNNAGDQTNDQDETKDNGETDETDETDGTDETDESNETYEEDEDEPRKVEKRDKKKVRPTKVSTQRNQRKLTDAQIIEMVRKWSIRFDGGTDAIEFIERVEELAECFNIPLNRLIKTLPELLRGRALAWHRNNRLDFRSWEQFTAGFYAFFVPSRYRKNLQREILERKQKSTESARDFSNSMQTMLRRDGQSPEGRMNRIYENLRTEYKMYIRPGDFKNLDELLDLADEFEFVRLEIRNEEKRSTQTSRNMAIEDSRPGYMVNYDRSTCCFRCGKRGHGRSNCRNTPILFCSFCGKVGIRSVDCHPGNFRAGANLDRAPANQNRVQSRSNHQDNTQ